MIPHDIPDRPFQKIAADICEYGNKNYLIVMDYFSKWLEIIPIVTKRSGELIKRFRSFFATHGIPEELIADNMPFSSYEFRVFANSWNFKIVTSSPRYPQSNGQAEKCVHIAKRILKKCTEDRCDYYTSLLEYRNTPIPGINSTPAQMLMSRRCRTKLPIRDELLCPQIIEGVKEKLRCRQIKNRKIIITNRQARKNT